MVEITLIRKKLCKILEVRESMGHLGTQEKPLSVCLEPVSEGKANRAIHKELAFYLEARWTHLNISILKVTI